MAQPLVIRVSKGVEVKVEEVEKLYDDDPRIPDDRNLVITAGSDLKLAVKRDAASAGVRAVVVTMCG